MNELLTCEGLTKSYQKGTNALDDIELHIGFGRIVGLLGPNGSGKTTLIKLANGLLQPTAGSIKIAGMAPGPDTKAIVSYLPDAAWLPDWMRVEQLVEMFRDFYADFDPAKANEMLEKLELSPDGAELIARLADGALRDALSILDTCAGVTAKIDADVVRRMAGVTDRSYLFRISDALEAQDGATALAQLAQLRQQSVDVKRLTEELIAHYRALMLAALPGGQSLLSGVSPEEEALYLEKGPQLGQREAIRAIRALGSALEHMTRGSDQRIELELALFGLSEPPQQPQAVPVQAAPVRAAAQPAAPQPFASATAVQPFASAPTPQPPIPSVPVVQPAAEPKPVKAEPSVPSEISVEQTSPVQTEELPPLPEEPPAQQAGMLPWDEPAAQAAQPAAPVPAELEPVPQPEPPKPAPTPAAKPVPEKPQDAGQEGTALYPYWPQVVQQLQEKDPMLYTYLRKSKAYFDGTRVLIDGGKTFRDFIRVNKDSQKLIKKLIAEVSGVPVPIGPYEPKTAGKTSSNAEQSLLALEKLGLEVSIEDTARKKR